MKYELWECFCPKCKGLHNDFIDTDNPPAHDKRLHGRWHYVQECDSCAVVGASEATRNWLKGFKDSLWAKWPKNRPAGKRPVTGRSRD